MTRRKSFDLGKFKTTAEKVGFHLGSEGADSVLAVRTMARAGYCPGTPNWSRALRGFQIGIDWLSTGEGAKS